MIYNSVKDQMTLKLPHTAFQKEVFINIGEEQNEIVEIKIPGDK